MLKYSINRILWTIPVLLIAILMTFGLVKQLPSSPFERNPKIFTNPQVLTNLNKKYGLDKPWYVQYSRYIQHLVVGDLGPSMINFDVKVETTIADRLPVSAQLGLLGFLVAAVFGIIFGMISAAGVNRWPDYGATLITTLGFAIPSFTVATVIYTYFNQYDLAGWDSTTEKIGPIMVLGLSIMPYFHRLVRAAMLETLESDFVLAARSKGISIWRVRTRHVLRNSLIPVVNNAGPLLGFVVTGSFIIELIFVVPGLGSNFVDSALNNDSNMLLGTTVVLTLAIVAVNLIVDLLLPLLDPRITHD